MKLIKIISFKHSDMISLGLHADIKIVTIAEKINNLPKYVYKKHIINASVKERPQTLPVPSEVICI